MTRSASFYSAVKETWNAKGGLRTLKAKLPELSEEERLIRLSAGAMILGVSPDAIRKRQAPAGVEELTIIDISRANSERRRLCLVYSEVTALRDRLIQAARDRMDVDRMLEHQFRRNSSRKR